MLQEDGKRDHAPQFAWGSACVCFTCNICGIQCGSSKADLGAGPQLFLFANPGGIESARLNGLSTRIVKCKSK